VAPRTGDKRLLIAPAKTTSARALLALVAAALLLAGCGGGSSGDGSTVAGGSSSSGSQPSEGTSASASPQGQSAGEGAEQGGSSAEAGAGAGSGPSGSAAGGQGAASGTGAKHGPRIAAPKGPKEQTASPKEVQEATVADMSLQSPAILASAGHLGRLDATYTCDGKDSWPQLKWGGVPAGSAELALFAMNLQPVNEKIFFDWALAGIDPGLTEIQAGKLPKGVIVGTNGFGRVGYSLCPQGAGETYMFALYALPTSLSPQRGFDPLELRKRVLDASGNAGLLPAVYERG
jgi:phosphatidylethanolamine-binding protein (PEBP) family uncharacterized protein